jgi:hypothetical protein
VSRDEIEAALAADFDREALAVYADLLQVEGDPRGEVIALQLANRDARGAIGRWLGTLPGDPKVELGFITGLKVSTDEMVETWLAHPASRYIRGVEIVGKIDWVTAAAELVTERSGRWLVDLSLHVEKKRGPMADDRAERIFKAAPRLERLAVHGDLVLGEVGHPNVRSLRVIGINAIHSLLWTGESRFPSVSELDLAFNGPTEMPFLDRLPALRRLDVSNNEPGTHPPHGYGWFAATVVLGEHAHLERVTHLRLPSIRSQDIADQLAQLIATMPNLEEVEIARAYDRFPVVDLPPIVKRPKQRWPWPPLDVAEGAIDIYSGHDDYSAMSLIRWLEQRYGGMRESEQAAWGRLFAFIDQQGGEPVEIPLQLLRDALAMLDGDPEVKFWIWLRDELASRDAAVMVRAWL